MSYASLDDLVARAGVTEILQVSDRDGDGTADPAVVSAAVTHAENTINGYLSGRYALPLSSTPDLVRTWATAIARYFLHRYGAPEYVEQDYKDAISALKDVAAGRMTLPVDPLGDAPSSGAGSVLAAHPAPNFDLRGWAQ